MRSNRGNRSTKFATVGLAMALCLALPVGAQAQRASAPVDYAGALARFHPTPLASQPLGEEDAAVWMAKVRGLYQGAPSVLQQSLLGSQSADEFAATLGLLEQMQQAKAQRYAVERRAQAQRSPDGRVQTKSLGGNDLVYRPVTPCRIVDSRSATSLPNPLLGGVAYNFKIYTATNFSAYGGSATTCSIPNSSTIDAIAMVISVLEEPSAARPNFSAFLGVSDSSTLSTVLGNVAVNFTQFRGISTMYVARAFSNDNLWMAMPAQLRANVVIDVVGYYIQSEATPLSCVNTAPTSQLIANGGQVQVIAPACTAGYTLVSTFCRLTTFTPNVFLLASGPDTGTGNARCSWLNQSGGNVTAETEARCCRVPGGSI